jgi:predicted glutamine amidotransferase
MIMLHHRMPTSSENKISQTHPILVNNGSLKHKYLVVHNGVINNEDEMREKHMNQLGFVYTTDRTTDTGKEEFNDSEALAIEVARFVEKQTSKIESIGSAAFIAYEIDKKTNKLLNVHFCRNSSPLKLSMTRNKIRLSSEGEGEDVKENTMYSFSIKDFKLKKRVCEMLIREPVVESKTETKPTYCGYSGYNRTDYGYKTVWNKQTESRYLETNPPIEYYTEKDEIIEDMVEDAQTDITDLIDMLSDSVQWSTGGKDMEEYIDTVFEGIKEDMKKKLPKLEKAIQEEWLEDTTYDQIPDKTTNTKEVAPTKEESPKATK